MSVLPTIVRDHWHIPVIQRAHGAHRRMQQIPALTGNERLLARTRPLNEDLVVGSDRALYVAGNPGIWRRIGWAEIASVARSNAGPDIVLRLWPTDAHGPDEVRMRADPVFAAFAAERVAATQVLRRRVPIPAGFAVVTAIRVPDRDDVVWRVQFDSDRARNDAAVRSAVLREIRELRALTGC